MSSTSVLRSITSWDGFSGSNIEDLGLACISFSNTPICPWSFPGYLFFGALLGQNEEPWTKASETSCTLAWKSVSKMLACERCAKTPLRKSLKSSTVEHNNGPCKWVRKENCKEKTRAIPLAGVSVLYDIMKSLVFVSTSGWFHVKKALFIFGSICPWTQPPSMYSLPFLFEHWL